MNVATRYIVTTSTVVVGLFVVGAAANAIANASSPDPGPIGDPVVVPSSTPVDDSPSAVIEVPAPEPSDLGQQHRYGWGDEDDEGGIEIEDD